MKRTYESVFNEALKECQNDEMKFYGVNCAEYADMKMESEYGYGYLDHASPELKEKIKRAKIQGDQYLITNNIFKRSVGDVFKPLTATSQRNMHVDWGKFLRYYRVNALKTENAALLAVNEMKHKYGDDFQTYIDMQLKNDINVNTQREANRIKKLGEPSVISKIAQPAKNVWDANLKLTEGLKNFADAFKKGGEDVDKNAGYMKYALVAVIGVSLLAGGGYAASQFSSAYKTVKNG